MSEIPVPFAFINSLYTLHSQAFETRNMELVSMILTIQFTVCPGFFHTHKFSSYCLTIYVFKVILLLLLNIYWEVNLGGWHFHIWPQPAAMHWPKHHLDAVMAHHVMSTRDSTLQLSQWWSFSSASPLQSGEPLRKSKEETKFTMSHCFRWTWVWHGWIRAFIRWPVTAKRWEWLGVRWARDLAGRRRLKGDLHPDGWALADFDSP